jgi:hypothetical protein
MQKSIFHRLCAELRSRALLEETFHVTIEEQVAMFIHVAGQDWSMRAADLSSRGQLRLLVDTSTLF